MRVACVSPWFRPHVGGVETHVELVSRELVHRGHEVTVVTSRYSRDLPEREVWKGVQILRVKILGVWVRTPVAPATKRAIGDLDVDIVHAHSPPPLSAYYGAKASRSRGIPFVVTYHCDIEVPSVFGPLVESLYRRTLGYATTRRANRIIMSTSTYAATSRAVWRYNPVVIANPVDVHRFHPANKGGSVREAHGVRNDEPMVLFVGRMYAHKGIENLIDAARYVPEAKFLFVGGGPELDTFQHLTHRLGVANRVAFPGPVPHELLPAYYAACDVFVLPSVSRLEAFGIVALEAMASGKPVVVSDIPGVREVIRDGVEGLLAEPVNPEDLARKIRALLADDSERNAMGRRGRDTAERNYSLELIVDRIEQVYRDAVAGRRVD